MDDKIECERCERERPEDSIKRVEIDEEHLLCEGCREDIETRVENYYWYDRYTEEQHDRAVEILEEQDEILCVHGDEYRAGEIIVHTNYVSSEAVSDVCDHFGLRIAGFGPRWQEEAIWDCVEERGSTFEILLEYSSNSPAPLPMHAPFHALDRDWLDDNDKQFDADRNL